MEAPKINDPRVVDIKTIESKEELVDLLQLGKIYRVSQLNNRDKIKFGDCEYTVARKGIADRLKMAIDLLPDGWGILLDEPYRSYAKQKELYEEQVAKVGPEKAVEFVSNPDVYSPHVTGGAIDVALVDNHGNMVDMGNWFDYDESAHTNFAKLSEPQKANRELLIKILSSAGFVNYPYEWWHWSYGDKYWGYLTGNKAIYDSINYA